MIWVVNLTILGIIFTLSFRAKRSEVEESHQLGRTEISRQARDDGIGTRDDEVGAQDDEKIATSLAAPRNDEGVTKWRWILFIILFIEAALLAYLTYKQYFLWLSNDLSKHLLPPYASINYFIFYTFVRIWAPHLMSLIAGLLAFWTAKWMNYKWGGRFFQSEEPYFLLIGTFLTGHPGWLMYWGLVFGVAIIVIASGTTPLVILRQSTETIFRWVSGRSRRIFRRSFANAQDDRQARDDRRVSLYYWWLPLAAMAILLDLVLRSYWSFYSTLFL
ncbi:MAG: hypothetical protein ABH822_00345 [Patescibacteria group bacterium]